MELNSTGRKIQSFQRRIFSTFTRKPRSVKSNKGALQQETCDQKQSALFTLPFELREIIWKFALGGRTIHLQNSDGRLGHVKCIDQTGEKWGLGDHHCWYRGYTNIGARLSYERCPAYGRHLGLLMTCHRIHNEAAHLLYTSNTISIRHIQLISQMRTGPFASRASLITSLHLSWTISWPTTWIVYPPVYGSSSTSQPHQQPTWLNAWQLLASFKGLKVLRVEFRNYYPPDGEADRRVRLLNELCCITQTNLFEVRVPWDLKDSGFIIQDAPFTLVGSDGKVCEWSKNWKKN